ncbi:hypothetical protein FK85_11155 [Halorubrum saccharovorum]|uniref:Uncharacterized protein n=1 Tax=Halorubrum saccharovorum TaxID=2248 RepID=A0A081ETG3_9EURY|nr:hypothetical protein FK85_11155 [Halorubrum saccharovorum]
MLLNITRVSVVATEWNTRKDGIYKDAKDRGSDWAWQWRFGTPLTVIAGLDVMLLVVVIYLLVRESA